MKQEKNGLQRLLTTARTWTSPVTYAVIYSTAHTILIGIAFASDDTTQWTAKMLVAVAANIVWVLLASDILAKTKLSPWSIKSNDVLYIPLPETPVIVIVDIGGFTIPQIAQYVDNDWYKWSPSPEIRIRLRGPVLSWCYPPPDVKLT